MPTVRRSRRIAAPADELWTVVSDPHHLPRWWPRVTRVEDVSEDAFTEVMRTKKGKTVRADFDLVRLDPETRTVQWDQLIAGTPFASVLVSSETEVSLEVLATAPALTEVNIELRQQMSAGGGRGGTPFGGSLIPRMGGRMVRKAAAATVEEALDGLERISG